MMATPSHSSRMALDWAGTYSGIIPCAGCPGIQVEATLNEDGTFERSTLYLDRPPAPITDSKNIVCPRFRAQMALAEQLKVGQDTVSRLERRTDMLLSTLSDYVRALGGELELNVEFPGRKRIRLKTLHEPAENGEAAA